MSLLGVFRNRAEGALARAVQGLRKPAPAASRPVDPVSGRVGVLVFQRDELLDGAPSVPTDWERDPQTGEALPTGPDAHFPPDRYQQARIDHRHGWFAALARHAAAQAGGTDAARLSAVAGLESWLRQDIPGHGLAWAHPSDLAVRLAHWHAGLSWLRAARDQGGGDAPASLVDHMAGSASWHLRHLDLRMPLKPEDGLRRVTHYCGMIIGGFTFPDLPESARARSEGLAGLRFELARQLYPDGSGVDQAPAALAQVLWLVAVARSVARANGAAFPADTDAAFARAARFLDRLAGDLGNLPLIGETPLTDLLPADDSLAGTLWNLALSWGLEQGAPAPVGRRLGWLGATVAGTPEPSSDKNWRLWCFRDGGVAIAWLKIKNQPSRLVVTMGPAGRGSPITHPAPLNVIWDVGTTRVLADPGSPGSVSAREATAHNTLTVEGQEGSANAALERSRVDGKKSRIEGHRRLRGGGMHYRDVLLNQARMIATDRLTGQGPFKVRMSWQLGPGWQIEPTEQGWTGKNGNITLVIQLPAGLRWETYEDAADVGRVEVDGKRVIAPCLVGIGEVESETELVSSFEVR